MKCGKPVSALQVCTQCLLGEVGMKIEVLVQVYRKLGNKKEEGHITAWRGLRNLHGKAVSAQRESLLSLELCLIA